MRIFFTVMMKSNDSLLMLLTGVCFFSSVVSVLVRKQPTLSRIRRVVGGAQVDSASEFPASGFIWRKNYEGSCSVSLISPTLILTSKTCMKNIKPEELEVQLGDLNVRHHSKSFNRQTRGVESFTLHATDDLAVLTLTRSIRRDSRAKAVKAGVVPREDSCLTFAGSTYKVAGFGLQSDKATGRNDYTLHSFSSTFSQKEYCTDKLVKQKRDLLCDTKREPRAEKGDAGAGVYVNKEGRDYLVAITHGYVNAEDNVDSVYLRLAPLCPWLETVTSGFNCTDVC
ncbi:hypothetical protein L596_021264 [Steinernema carpocapsae]|uniref:Peptidase S1 domain-containing protein n=1 Tax=Steinernema carpocapsae TaxID=34508 RepID=A0A4U5MJ17_STECR|nr:hypothetical protein L596_021264 [Steinernema carpocapsae]